MSPLETLLFILLLIFSGGVLWIVFGIYILPHILRRVERYRYARSARIHNEKARLLRLEKDEWFGYPMPKGKEGRIVITREDLLHKHTLMSSRKLEKIYFDRAQDMHVELEIMHDVISQDTIIMWKPKKGKRPREHY